MAKVDDLGSRAVINKLAESLKSTGNNSTKTKEAESSSPDYVLKTSSLKERAQALIESGQFSEKDLDFLQEVIANKDIE